MKQEGEVVAFRGRDSRFSHYGSVRDTFVCVGFIRKRLSGNLFNPGPFVIVPMTSWVPSRLLLVLKSSVHSC